jgi:nucleoside-diphosphate-sugar epimerase
VTLLEHVRAGHVVYVSSGAVYDGLNGPVSPATAVAPRLPYAIS